MNFLAHSLLGFDDTALIAGQFCGDFVRGSDLSAYPAGIERGIRLHRRLDVFTDAYPALQPAREQLQGVPRRFAGIVIDVLFDHYLATRWETVSDQSLETHAQRVHGALREHEAVLPEKLLRFMNALEKHDILVRNRELAAIELTLARLASRSPRFGALAMSTAALLPLRDQLQAPFDAFFPELHQTALSYLASHPLSDVRTNCAGAID